MLKNPRAKENVPFFHHRNGRGEGQGGGGRDGLNFSFELWKFVTSDVLLFLS